MLGRSARDVEPVRWSSGNRRWLWGAGTRSLYGYGPPVLSARTEETAPSMAATAEKEARMIDRSFTNRRWGMPGSFQGPGVRAPMGRVCCADAIVNYC
jgi:hypothetical protein